MSILINDKTRVIIQGLTGKEGLFHAKQMIAYGTKVAAGVTPGKGGQRYLGIPVFNTVNEAVIKTKADTSIIFVPAAMAADAACEAADAGIKKIVIISENIPIIDMIRVKTFLKIKKTHMIGPNCPGIISPGQCKVGIMPSYIHKQGQLGVISRSGTLTYEVVNQLTNIGLGQSTCIGIGGDPIIGLNFVDLLKMFIDDLDTKAICLIGEIGGNTEEKAASYIKTSNYPKPVFGFIAGLTAPPNKRMGHAGAIINGSKGYASDKIIAMQDAGIHIINDLSKFAKQVANTLNTV